MRNLYRFHRPMLAVGLLIAFAALPVSRVVAQGAMSSPQASSSSSGNETLSGKTSDTWITTKVKSELMDAKNVKSTDISVTTTEGVVALTGTVASTRVKDHVIHVVKKVKGVKDVDASGLTIVPAASDRGQ